MIKSDSIAKIAAALVTAQSQMGNATKDSSNPFFRSKFADLNSIREATIPVLNANGISILQPTIPVDGKQFVETMLLHSSGEYLAAQTEIVCAKQNDPQAYGSAVSYARRYGLQALVCIGAVDDDSEAAMGRTNSKPTATQPKTETKIAPKVEVKDKTNDLDVALAPTTPVTVETVVAAKPAPGKFKVPAKKTADKASQELF